MKKLTLTELRKIETKSRKITATCRAKEDKRSGTKPRDRHSEKAKAVATAIDKAGFCGSYRRGIRQIVEAVMGTSLPSNGSGSGGILRGFFVKHAVIVCTANPNSHDYGRRPLLLLKGLVDGECGSNLKITGSRGNILPDAYKKDSPMRYATAKEVTTFFDAMRKRIREKKRVAYYSYRYYGIVQ